MHTMPWIQRVLTLCADWPAAMAQVCPFLCSSLFPCEPLFHFVIRKHCKLLPNLSSQPEPWGEYKADVSVITDAKYQRVTEFFTLPSVLLG